MLFVNNILHVISKTVKTSLTLAIILGFRVPTHLFFYYFLCLQSSILHQIEMVCFPSSIRRFAQVGNKIHHRIICPVVT